MHGASPSPRFRSAPPVGACFTRASARAATPPEQAEDRATKWYDGCPCSMYEYSYWYNTDYLPLDSGNAQDEVGFWGIDASNVFEQLQVYKGATADWTKHRYHPEDPTKGLEETTGNGMLTNGVVMEKAAEFCEIALKQLKLDLAGRHGTVNIQNVSARARARAPFRLSRCGA